jgi:hypothetical protein
MATCKLNFSLLTHANWMVYKQETGLHRLWQKIGKASVAKQVSVSWFHKNIPYAIQLRKVPFLPPTYGPAITSLFLFLLKGGIRKGNLKERNHFYHFSSGLQLCLSCLSPRLVDWLEYVDRDDKVVSLQSIAVTQHLILPPLTQIMA